MEPAHASQLCSRCGYPRVRLPDGALAPACPECGGTRFHLSCFPRPVRVPRLLWIVLVGLVLVGGMLMYGAPHNRLGGPTGPRFGLGATLSGIGFTGMFYAVEIGAGWRGLVRRLVMIAAFAVVGLMATIVWMFVVLWLEAVLVPTM
jgi:hypothetical protein